MRVFRAVSRAATASRGASNAALRLRSAAAATSAARRVRAVGSCARAASHWTYAASWTTTAGPDTTKQAYDAAAAAGATDGPSAAGTGASAGAGADASRARSDAAFDESFRAQLLDAALKHVPERGWTMDAVRAAAASQGLSASAAGVCARGAYDLVDHYMGLQNDRALALLQAMPLAHMSVAEKLRAAVRTRLELLQPVLSSWASAMAVGAQPQHALATAARIGDYAHRTWLLCGDASTDLNWYAKRALFMAVYTATELYLLTDKSHAYADTWAFLARRVDDALAVAAVPNAVGAVSYAVWNFALANVLPTANPVASGRPGSGASAAPASTSASASAAATPADSTAAVDSAATPRS